jgi:hypothetical protein
VIDRKSLAKGAVVWLGEMYAGSVRVEKATVRRKPRGRGGVWLEGCSRLLASEYQLFPSEAEAFKHIHESAAEALQYAQADADAAKRALVDFEWRNSGARR